MYYERSGMFGGRYRGEVAAREALVRAHPKLLSFVRKKPLIAERLLDG